MLGESHKMEVYSVRKEMEEEKSKIEKAYR